MSTRGKTDPSKPPGVGRLAALGRALSDPIRVRMLGMMAEAAASGWSRGSRGHFGGECFEAYSAGIDLTGERGLFASSLRYASAG